MLTLKLKTTRIIYKKQLKQLSRQSTYWRDKENNT